MKTNEKPPQQVSPVLLVLLGLILVGALLYIFVFNKTSSPINTINQLVSNVVPQNTSKESPEKLDDEIDSVDEITLVPSEGRNPFMVPSLYRRINDELLKVEEKKLTITPLEEEKKKDVPKLGAIFIKRNDKVAVIYFENKGHILREQNLVPGSSYRVCAIDKDRVIITDEVGKETVLDLRGDHR